MKKLSILIIMLISFALMPVLAHAEASLQITSSTNPVIVQPGNDGYIDIIISNVGNAPASSLTLSLVSIDNPIIAKTPFYLESLGSVEPGKSSSVVFRFNVPTSASSGYYTAQFKIKYCDGSVCKDYVQYSLITVQSPAAVKIVGVEPNELTIGTNNTINFIVENIGDSPISNVFVKWESTESTILPFGSDNEIYIPSIGNKQRKSIPAEIFVDQKTESGIYPLTITLRYTDSSGLPQITTSTTGVVVKGITDFVIRPDNEKLYYGAPGEITIYIANKGTESAEFLTAKLVSDYGSEEYYIGSLKADDEESVTFKQDLTKVSSPYETNLILSYRDKFNNERTFEKKITVNAIFTPANYTGLIIILVLIAGISYWYWNKKRKK